ncbi:MAG: ParB/RepB/Spo0J family partition protein [Anaerolineaceae bacterium]|nr:ParB/RepB/Spo0J family partition protein [Anaerolineaceae bacterium]
MAAQKKSGLGRGLDALFSNSLMDSDESVKTVPLTSISPNPRQPRSIFTDEELAELAESIREHGVIQPLIVSDNGDGTYILIAGERRLRASQLAGLNSVPVVVRKADDQELLELALIENIQREDLSPLEAAEAYKSLEENFNLTHEEISKRVGKNRASVTNTMRLLKLPGEVKKALLEKKITEGHARVLLSLPTPQAQINAMNHIINNDLNVRQAEEYIRNLVGEKRPEEPKQTKKLDPEMQEIENHLRQLVGTKVSLKPGKNGTGSISIHYYSTEDLESIIDKLSNH